MAGGSDVRVRPLLSLPPHQRARPFVHLTGCRQGTLGAIVRARLTDFWRTLWACLFGQVGLARGAGTGSEGASGLVRTLSPLPIASTLLAACGGVCGAGLASVVVGGSICSPLGGRVATP